MITYSPYVDITYLPIQPVPWLLHLYLIPQADHVQFGQHRISHTAPVLFPFEGKNWTRRLLELFLMQGRLLPLPMFSTILTWLSPILI